MGAIRHEGIRLFGGTNFGLPKVVLELTIEFPTANVPRESPVPVMIPAFGENDTVPLVTIEFEPAAAVDQIEDC